MKRAHVIYTAQHKDHGERQFELTMEVYGDLSSGQPLVLTAFEGAIMELEEVPSMGLSWHSHHIDTLNFLDTY